MALGPEYIFQERLRGRLDLRGCKVRKTHGTQYSRSWFDLQIEINDFFRHVEVKALDPKSTWTLASPVPVMGDLRPDQWNEGQSSAIVNRRPKHVASLEVKALDPKSTWTLASPVPGMGDLRPDQWNEGQSSAIVNRRPKHVASLVVTCMKVAAYREIYFAVLAGSPIYVKRDYTVPWGLIINLQPGKAFVWPEDGLVVTSYDLVSSKSAANPMPTWPILRDWWNWGSSVPIQCNDPE